MTTQLEKEIARLAGIGIDVTNHPTSPYAEPIIRQQQYPNNPDIGPRCGECRLGLGVHNTSDPYCDHHITNSGEPHEDQ